MQFYVQSAASCSEMNSTHDIVQKFETVLPKSACLSDTKTGKFRKKGMQIRYLF